MKEMYVSLSAAMAHERNLAVVANNLANVNSVGFKRETAVFEVQPPQPDLARLARSASSELGLPPPRQKIEGGVSYMRLAVTDVDYSHGELKPTSNPLDMALQEGNPRKGVALFVVQTPDGERYTRAGNFVVNSAQELVTPDGLRVMSKGGGALKIENGPIEVTSLGEVSAKGRPIGTLKVAFCAQPASLRKLGNGFYSTGNGDALPDATPQDGISVRQGYVETSNVNVVSELVRMIETQRAYTGLEKSIQSIDDTTQKVINQAISA